MPESFLQLDSGEQSQIYRALGPRLSRAPVVKHKKVFYNIGYANYDACLAGELRLLPDKLLLAALREDFQHMIDAGMFVGDPPAFDVIISRLRALEVTVNQFRSSG